MITVSDLSFNFGTQTLFKGVDLKFTPGNCYGIIGANGAGKSTFLKILCGELEPSHGSVIIPPTVRMSVLRQDHYAFDEYTVLDTVIMGNRRLYDIMKEKDALYEKPDFSEEDGMRAAVLEEEFAELDGWEAESDASKLIQGLGLEESLLHEADGVALRFAEGQSSACAGAFRQPRYNPARRAYERPRYSRCQVARGFPERVFRNGHSRFA